MVLLLRAPFVDPNPIEAALDKFVEKFTASMKTWSHEFVKTIKQPQPKSDTKHDRKVLICGYMEEEECFCVATEIMESEYDLDDAVVEFEEKKGYQNHLQIQQDDNPIVFEFGDNEGFQTKIEGPNPLIHQLPDQLIHGKAEGFETFIDKETIRVGDQLDSRIRDGIKGSMSAIVVFSENYAYSTWCLDELLLILDRKKNSKYFIIPIFYEVEPKDIKHQLGNYGAALERHKERHNNDKVEKWRQALIQVANILGEHVQGMQNNFIKKIVKLFGEKLSEEFPQLGLPLPVNPVLQGNRSDSTWYSKGKDKVVLYTTGKEDGIGSNAILRLIMVKNNVMFEERNCYKDPKYITELEELVGNDNVIRLPMVIVNGIDLCGEEEVEGFEDVDGIRVKHKLKSALNTINLTARQIESMRMRMRSSSSNYNRNINTSSKSRFMDTYRMNKG